MAKLSLSRISDYIRRKVENSKIVQFATRKLIEARIRPLFNQLRDEMIEELENHPITEEINLGPKLGWSSKFLGGYGDLFSFIGFNRDDDPIEPIRKLFRGLRLYSVTSKGLNHIYEIRNFPTREDVKKITPLPWKNGKSWALGMEEGISGLGRYLNTETIYDPPHFRSTAGLQLKNGPILRAAFQPTPYITPILKKFRERFLAISNTKVIGIRK